MRSEVSLEPPSAPESCGTLGTFAALDPIARHNRTE